MTLTPLVLLLILTLLFAVASLVPLVFLLSLALLFAVASLVPSWPSHPLLAFAVMLLAVCMLAGVAVRG